MKPVADPCRVPLTTKVTRPESAALKLISKKRNITRSRLIREYILRGLETERAA